MNQLLALDQTLDEMYLSQALHHRTIHFIEEFERESCYKAIYLMERIERLDDEENLPVEKRGHIKIVINSYGGVVYDLLAMASTIKRLQNRGYIIETHVQGVAMSCGFLLAIMGTKGYRTMGEYATIMHHQHSSGCMGEYQTMVEDIEEQHKLWAVICGLVKAHTSITQEQLDDMKSRKFNWFMDSKDAINLNCIDSIY